MALRERIGQDAQHERHGRHGRPKPFGGRLRLPTLRFSGAAMAMSTVVGISIATTWLLHEQQGVGRRAGVARVGSSPPPTPGTERADAASAPDAPHAPTAPLPSGRPSGAASPGPHASYPPASALPAPRSPSTGTTVPLAEGRTGSRGPSDGPSTHAVGPAQQQDGPATTAARPSADRPPYPQPEALESAAQPLPTQSTSPQRPFAPAPTPVAPGVRPPGEFGELADGWTGVAPEAPTVPKEQGGEADPEPHGTVDLALTGAALVQQLGHDGTRHVLALTVAEPLTALQAELRLTPDEPAPGEPAPGIAGASGTAGTAWTAWTDLAGAVVTTHHERGTLVYRFTTPAGVDVAPGRYTFGVRSALPATAPTTGAPTPGRPTPALAAPTSAAPTSAGSAGPSPGEAAPGGPRKAAPVESWSASAFGIQRPRAVAALGTFAAPPS
ncbi:hypothetical protein [Kitasatospora sp. NPDC050463]|uniref:hypothetical protein n=1 Tax=Kitasatospora sp. NPDC050463 TaxID=3155786 RepID=UPI0033E4E42A